jgi:hypothetical protein
VVVMSAKSKGWATRHVSSLESFTARRVYRRQLHVDTRSLGIRSLGMVRGRELQCLELVPDCKQHNRTLVGLGHFLSHLVGLLAL